MMIRIRCRLKELLQEKNVAPDELAVASGLSRETIEAYCDDALDSISLSDAGLILTVLGCTQITDLLEEELVEGPVAGTEEGESIPEADWHSSCTAAPDGKHRWYKDMEASDTLLQVFTCYACRKRLSVIL